MLIKRHFQDVDESDICNQPEEAGNCDEYVIQYSYDAAHGYCKAFYYGGCGGNSNRFGTQVECESACVDRRPPSRGSEGKLRQVIWVPFILFLGKKNVKNIQQTIIIRNHNMESVVRSSID